MKTLREMIDLIESAQTTNGGKLTPEQSKELKGYIDAYRDATDPEGYYDQDPDGDNPDPGEILGTIAGKFGQEIADTIANGPSMHYPRPNHAWQQSDPMDPMFDKTPRVTKAGKVNQQDVNVLKKNIKRRVGDHTRPNLPEEATPEAVQKINKLFQDKK